MNKANKIYIDKANLAFCYYLCLRYGLPDKNDNIKYSAVDLNKRLKELREINEFAYKQLNRPHGIMQQIRQSNIKYYNKDLIKKDLEQWLNNLE